MGLDIKMAPRGLALDSESKVGGTLTSFKESFLTPGDEWVRVGVGDDGSCFYHSIACIMNHSFKGVPYHDTKKEDKLCVGHNLRHLLERGLTPKLWEEICACHGVEDSAPSFADVQKRLQGTKTWANYWTILATCHLLRLNLIFYDMMAGGHPYCGATHTGTAEMKHRDPTLPDMGWRVGCICWIQRCHFEPLRCNGDFMFTPKSTIGRTLLDRYKTTGGCRLLLMQEIRRLRQDPIHGGSDTENIADMARRLDMYMTLNMSPFVSIWDRQSPFVFAYI
jgi:hypothetical protein